MAESDQLLPDFQPACKARLNSIQNSYACAFDDVSHPSFFRALAEQDGRFVGSNCAGTADFEFRGESDQRQHKGAGRHAEGILAFHLHLPGDQLSIQAALHDLIQHW